MKELSQSYYPTAGTNQQTFDQIIQMTANKIKEYEKDIWKSCCEFVIESAKQAKVQINQEGIEKYAMVIAGAFVIGLMIGACIGFGNALLLQQSLPQIALGLSFGV